MGARFNKVGKKTAVFSIAFVILVVVGILNQRSIRLYSEAVEVRAETREMLIQLKSLLTDLQDAETGQRGYLLTGDQRYLEPYLQSQTHISQRLGKLRELNQRNPDHSVDLEALTPLIDEKLRELQETIETRQTQGLDAALAIVKSDRGKKAMDQIRQLIADKTAEASGAIQTRTELAARNAARARMTFWVGGAISFALLLLTFYWFWEEKRASEAAARLTEELNNKLEQRVRERTAELSASNAALNEAKHDLESKVAQRTEELTQANEKLKEVDRLKSEFLATMSHELRTPLNSIIGFTGILRQELAGPINAEQKKQLSMVQSSGRHLLNLINDLLDLSRIESGKMEVVEEPFEFEPLVDEVMQTLLPSASMKGIVLEKDLRVPGQICSDRKKVFQILLNLANNAVKFTDKGKVKISGERSNGTLAVRVTDTGIGIQREKQTMLFEAFRQIEGSAKRQYEGTGLGLYLCRKLLSLLGGEISVESEFGKGSRFSFRIPVEQTAGGAV